MFTLSPSKNICILDIHTETCMWMDTISDYAITRVKLPLILKKQHFKIGTTTYENIKEIEHIFIGYEVFFYIDSETVYGMLEKGSI